MQTKKRKKRKHLFVIELVLPTINLTQRKVLSMINSIQHFIEKGTYEIEDTMREFVEGTLDIDAYGTQLQEKALKLTRDILVETLETMDQIIKDSEKRKEAYVVEQRNQPKTLLFPFGSICFHRTCYTSKKTGKSNYLLDDLIGLEKHQRLTTGAEAAILEETIESSYRKGGEHASLTEQVSKQTVKKLVHQTVTEMPVEEAAEKKKIKRLHIDADEDHVSAQFYKRKGDLVKDERGRKHNTLMPKLICVYEDIEEESGSGCKSKRYRLTGKRYFSGLHTGKGNEDLWEEVRDYIASRYDPDYLEKIYIAGDGAAWIKAGCEVLEKAHFVLDKFHMSKYINRSVLHLMDSAEEVKSEIYEALYKKDKRQVREIYKKILKVTGKESKYQEVEESLRYLMNNWRGITIYSDDGGAVWGCHAEGQVSHVLSSRMSSRPMGWSRTGADQMSKLRAYHMNGGKIIDLLKYQKSRQQRERRIEKQEELVRELRRVQAGRKYAERLQVSVPGKERESMKWMRELLNQQLCC